MEETGAACLLLQSRHDDAFVLSDARASFADFGARLSVFPVNFVAQKYQMMVQILEQMLSTP